MERNRIVCSYDTHIQHNQGFYKGMDLIPDAIDKDGLPKQCPCGVNKSEYFATFDLFYFIFLTFDNKSLLLNVSGKFCKS